MTPIVLDGGAPLPQSFVLKVGSIDLAEYLRVSPGEGFDPADGDYSTPQFSSSPLREGGEFVLDNVGLREKVWPLILKAPSKDELHAFIRDINNELDKPGLQVEWADAGAADSTFYDVARGRLEVEFNFRRAQHSYANATLRIWTQPYGHTATERIVATAAGSGCLITAAVATRVEGDAPALIDARVTVGSQVPTGGRLVALSVLGHPSYAARYPAASIGDLMGGGALVGASGAAGSQYLGLPVSPTGASGISCKVPLALPTVYLGRNRILGLARAHIAGGVAVSVLDAEGNRLGPTALASQSEGWGLVDLGVFTIDPALPYPTAPKLSLQAGGLTLASGIEGPAIDASPGLHLNEIYVLPEERTAVIVDAPQDQAAFDSFERDANLAGAVDKVGNAWATGLTASAYFETWPGNGGYAFSPGVGGFVAAAWLPDLRVNDTRLVARHRLSSGGATRSLTLRKEAATNVWAEARVQLRPSAYLAVRQNAAGVGIATAIACAALPVASLVIDGALRLTFETIGGRAHAALARTDGGWSASAGASDAAFAIAGNPVMAAEDGARVEEFAVEPIATTNTAPADVYHLDDVNDVTWRQKAAGDLTGRLAAHQRGHTPRLAAPSAAAVAAVVAPLNGIANGVCAVHVRARERFKFAR